MPVVENVSLGGGQVALLSKVTQISSAQIVTLDTVPVVVVSAPGAGKLIVPIGILFEYNFGTRKYIGSGSDLVDTVYASTLAAFTINGFVGNLIGSIASGFQYLTGQVGNSSALAGNTNQALELQAEQSYNIGPILTATLGAGGAGYVANDTGTITNGANNATYKVLTVGAGGAVLTFQITSPGTACTVANGNGTIDGGAQPGVGAGFTVNITAVQTGDGTLKVVTYYQIIAVP